LQAINQIFPTFCQDTVTMADAAAPAAAPKAPKASKATKPRAKPAHPPAGDLVVEVRFKSEHPMQL
jgi:hypothetical protein